MKPASCGQDKLRNIRMVNVMREQSIRVNKGETEDFQKGRKRED